MKIVLTIIIAIMQALIVIIPLKGKLSDNRSKFPRNFTKLGYSLIVFCIITIICTILLFTTSEQEQKNTQKLLQTELKNRDSINQNKIDAANEKYIFKLDSSDKNTIKLLAQYGLKYDSSEKRIEKLVTDSANKHITIINSEDPIFNLCDVEVVNKNTDSITFKLIFCSRDATSYNIDFKLDFFSKIGRGDEYFYIYRNLKILPPNTNINKDKFQSIEMGIKNFNTSAYFFHLRGTYKKFDGKLLILDNIVSFDFVDPKPHFGMPNAIEYEKIKKFIQLNN